MPYYESVFIARQDISQTQVEGLSDAFEKIITDAGGSIAKRENWGLRTMAYKINKNRKGHYVLLNVDAPAPALREMERQMRINEDILRYISIRVNKLEDAPSAIMRIKDRSERTRQVRGAKQEFDTNLPITELAEAKDHPPPSANAEINQNPAGNEG